MVTGGLVLLGHGGITSHAVTALGIEEIEPEPTALVYRLKGLDRAWLVRGGTDFDPAAIAPAGFSRRDDAIAYARQRFGERVKVEE